MEAVDGFGDGFVIAVGGDVAAAQASELDFIDINGSHWGLRECRLPGVKANPNTGTRLRRG